MLIGKNGVAEVINLIASGAYGAPMLKKRIAQVISASTTKWEQACLAAGGGQQCNAVSVTAFGTLLAAPGPCEQQNAADQMIDLAKQLNNDPEMIRLTQIFVQQPRNTPTSQSVPYCQQAPRNAELDRLFQCQFAGVDPSVFVGGLAVGQSGTVPFGITAPINPAGSCPAHTSGPIADGSQLIDIIQGSGMNSTSIGSTSPSVTTTTVSTSKSSSTASTSTAPSNTPSGSSSTSSNSSAGGFQLQNGKDAQVLNTQFATLTTDSHCSTGDQACIDGGFAQCIGGKFVVTQCAASTGCFALPLVNSPGTSIACTTEADATRRFAASGVTGGPLGQAPSTTDSSNSVPCTINTAASANITSASTSNLSSFASSAVSAAPTSASGDFRLQNGKDAQSLNAKFATLTADSACTSEKIFFYKLGSVHP
ncbi:hypothetical protein C0995_008465 [Termitomyces sp. Mi166|nr:hypothetical protein C0995_008465 [Termitomyces sp. Mi166\